MNVVQPNLIRVESDEATYNLHIMLRFDLERALLLGELAIDELPGAWNERMKQDLGLDVPDDRRGCLQDIHWAMGAVGYFPTYTLGNLYAAQLWDAIVRDVPDVEEGIGRGDFAPLLGWLRANVHGYGSKFKPGEVIQRATGEPLTSRYYADYLTTKYRDIYSL